MSDTYDTDILDSDSPDDSPIIKDLRARLRAEAKRAKELETRMGEVEAATQTRRAEAAEQLMNALGFPGLKDDILNWVEGDITEQSVQAALQARSLSTPGTSVPEGTEQQDSGAAKSASIVGQRVADAAGGRDSRDLDRRIAEAATPAELHAVMAEAGLTRSHS